MIPKRNKQIASSVYCSDCGVMAFEQENDGRVADLLPRSMECGDNGCDPPWRDVVDHTCPYWIPADAVKVACNTLFRVACLAVPCDHDAVFCDFGRMSWGFAWKCAGGGRSSVSARVFSLPLRRVHLSLVCAVFRCAILSARLPFGGNGRFLRSCDFDGISRSLSSDIHCLSRNGPPFFWPSFFDGQRLFSLVKLCKFIDKDAPL